MSKSLKNFITIRSVLQRYNARQLRILFLLHKYDSPMNYSEEAMIEAVNVERSFADFFGSVKAAIREAGQVNSTCKPDGSDHKLLNDLTLAKKEVREALCNNFNTQEAMTVLSSLMRNTNLYLREKGNSGSAFSLRTVASFITRILNIFGING
mmetsp:Transcript_8191/g.16545  ORF Transcript_8191/g.16545 Transcript_8191/m.16545 type:complete len:153 (+) Transcript_8191:1185-1643(+)